MRMTSRILISAALAISIVSCKPTGPSASPSKESARGKPVVMVANYPLKYFAERIGDDMIAVQFPAPPDEDPAFWQPADDVISAFQSADLTLMNGATYSKWAEKTTLPASKIVDTSAAFKADFIEEKNAVTHSHGTGGDHSHSGTAFTTWLDFEQAIAQATAARAGIGRVLPDAGAKLDQNLAKLIEELRALDDRMKTVGKRMNNQPLVASHPVYQYWARRYGIHLKFVVWEPEEVPTDNQMDDLKAILAVHPAKWMVWEGEPAKESVEKIKALGLQNVVFDPCGNAPESGDFLSTMKTNVEAVEKAFP